MWFKAFASLFLNDTEYAWDVCESKLLQLKFPEGSLWRNTKVAP